MCSVSEYVAAADERRARSRAASRQAIGFMTGERLGSGQVPEQVAVLAVRKIGAIPKICLIRKNDSAEWGIPKGLIDPGDTAEEAALKEAWEEAGIIGRLVGASIGTYAYEKWGATLRVAVYRMKVLDESASWPEMRFRERSWSSMTEAASRLALHPVRPLLDRLSVSLDGE
jgi:phosphohistidine phosphatase